MSVSRVVLRFLVVVGVVAAFWSPVAGQQSARRTLTLDDLSKVRAVSDPQVSPEGGWVAYVVGSSDLEKDKRDSDIWMVSWDGTIDRISDLNC